MSRVVIIGAGLAGLTAAITLAKNGKKSFLISIRRSERAQSVLAEGGINAALDTMGENDSTHEHYEDTLRGGAFLADPEAVKRLASNAPDTVKWLASLGVPFNMENGRIIQRNFGGQKKKRTAFAKSSTGKMIMTALIDEARKYEASGYIKRYPHHEFLRLITDNGRCAGARIKDIYSGRCADFFGAVILCTGGMNGVFPAMTTGTTQNTGDAAAAVFAQGVRLSNAEMLQYHPTTIGITGKRCLVTEAARGEGGRLFINRNGEKYYFMEDRHPVLKNLSPRDVVAREMYFVRREQDNAQSVYLDMTELSGGVWQNKLPDLRAELTDYLAIDPKTEPVPVKEGIHYFMGGIDSDIYHKTSMEGLYAAGECTSIYHGANRLGGNSMLGAVFGGKTAAESVLKALSDTNDTEPDFEEPDENEPFYEEASPKLKEDICDILLEGLGIVRNEAGLERCLEKLRALSQEREYNDRERARLLLAEAMLTSASERRESRGAHYREDYPKSDDKFKKPTLAEVKNGRVKVFF